MKLKDHTIEAFCGRVCSSDPVPGGGSVSAMAGAIAASLAQMVAGLTVGKKKYAEVEGDMQKVIDEVETIKNDLLTYIDKDSEAYDAVVQAFKLPKETEEDKAKRAEAIEEATILAASVPMEVAERAYQLVPYIQKVLESGNQNAVTDACIAMMSCRVAVIGALLNVRINLGSIKNEAFVKEATAKAEKMEGTIDGYVEQALKHTYSAL